MHGVVQISDEAIEQARFSPAGIGRAAYGRGRTPFPTLRYKDRKSLNEYKS